MEERIKLILGLGNPGKEYDKTYHNVGHIFIESLKKARLEDISLKSEVFMNNSGLFARKILKKQGLEAGNLLVAHDDSDIELGKFKLSFGRSSGGHKGVESVIKALRTKNFWRLRIGIRPATRTATRRIKAEEFVLKRIKPADQKTLGYVFEQAADSLTEKTTPPEVD